MSILATVCCLLLVWNLWLTYRVAHLERRQDDRDSGAREGSSSGTATAEYAREEEDPAPTTRPGQAGPGLVDQRHPLRGYRVPTDAERPPFPQGK